MKILVLTSAVPYPPHGGGHARIHAMLRQLSREHTVDLVSLARPHELIHRQALERLCREVVFLAAPPPARNGCRRWVTALRNLVLLRGHDADPGVRRALAERLLARGYDLIQVENSYMIPYAAQARGIPKALDIFGTWRAGMARDLAAQETLAGRLRVVVAWLKAKRIERGLSRVFDGLYVVSEADRDYLSGVDPRLEIHVVPNGVDTDHFVPAPGPAGPPLHLVFTGAMDYSANEDAVLFFHREIYPTLVDRLREVRFWVVGRDPGPRLTGLARDPRITVTGAVEDVRPYLTRATVVVVPLRLGAGTRIKIIEALAMGKAVVSTRVGAEGLAVVPGRHLIVADTPEAFAAAVVHLAGNPAARERLGREGRALVETEYDWRVVLAPMSRAVNGLARHGGGRAWVRSAS